MQTGDDAPRPPTRSSTVNVPIWLVAATALVVGVVAGSTSTLLGLRTASDTAKPTAAPAPAITHTVTITATATVTRKIKPKPEQSGHGSDASSPTPDAGPTATPTPSAQPRGTLLVLSGPEGGFGQDFPRGRCAIWKAGFINQSDTGIDRIVVAPPTGTYSYTDYSKDMPDLYAAPPQPAVLNLYIAPGNQTAVEFRTCTSTPPPKDRRYEFSATAPDNVAFRWETGDEGVACYRC